MVNDKNEGRSKKNKQLRVDNRSIKLERRMKRMYACILHMSKSYDNENEYEYKLKMK